MPFKKIGKNTYESSSGRKYTKKQLNLYHATDGFTKPVRSKNKSKNRSKR